MAAIHITIGFFELGAETIDRLAVKPSAVYDISGKERDIPVLNAKTNGLDFIIKETEKYIRQGHDIIWDCGLCASAERKEYYRQARKLTADVIFHVMLHDWAFSAENLKICEPWSAADKCPVFFYHAKNNEIYALPFNRGITLTHFGVYGAAVKDGKILLIKKTRGPYAGMYDLPGGSPENGESYAETLRREINEETGLDVVKAENERFRSIIFPDFTLASKKTGVLRHNAVLCDVTVKGEMRQDGDGRDSGGAAWIDVSDLTAENASPYALTSAGLPVIATANADDEPFGVAIRGVPLKPDRFPMIAAVLLFNSQGNLIMQKIAARKRWGGLWTYSAAGHVDAGEDYRAAAERELTEEMGIKTAIGREIAAFPLKRDGKLIAFHHVFIAFSDDKVTPDPTEVAAVREISLPDLQREITCDRERFFDAFLTAAKIYLARSTM